MKDSGREHQQCHLQGGGGTRRGKRLKANKQKSTSSQSVLSTSSSVSVSRAVSQRGKCATAQEKSVFILTSESLQSTRWNQERQGRRMRQRANRRLAMVAAPRTGEKEIPCDPAQAQVRKSPRLRSRSARLARRRRNRRRLYCEELKRQSVAKLVQLVNLYGGTTFNEDTPGLSVDWRNSTDRETGQQMGTITSSSKELSLAACTAVQTTSAASAPKRELKDGLLLYIPIRIFGKPAKALVDSGASRNFISPAAVVRLGVFTTHENCALELANGQRILSQGKAPGVLVTVGSDAGKYDLTVCTLLPNVDVILGMTWLSKANPLIDWGTPRLIFPRETTTTAIVGQWAEPSQTVCQIRTLRNFSIPPSRLLHPQCGSSLDVLASPSFWRYVPSGHGWHRGSSSGGAWCGCRF